MTEQEEEEINGAIAFIRSISVRDLAEYIISQNKAIEGLTENNKTFIKAFGLIKISESKRRAESFIQHGYIKDL